MPWWIWALLPFALLALLALWVTILEALDARRARKLLREIERNHKQTSLRHHYGAAWGDRCKKAKWD